MFAFASVCNFLWSSSCCCFSVSRVRDFRIIISIPDFENPSIWRIDAVQIDIRIVISISIRSMIPRFGRQVHLEELTQMKLIKHVLITSERVSKRAIDEMVSFGSCDFEKTF